MIEGMPPTTVMAGLAIVAFGGWSLTFYFVRLIFVGRLVPSHDRDEWRAESRIKDQTIHEMTEQNTAMLREFGPTVTDLLRGIRRQADAVEEEST
jgi:hypothetical protein